VCAVCQTPHLKLRFQFRPSWNNIHDTFPTGTAQETTGIHSVKREVTDEERNGNYFECFGRGRNAIHAGKLRTFKFRTADVKAEFLMEHLPETPEVIRI
jgi:hypothetical protein